MKGTLKVWPDTDFPERFDEGRTVWIEDKPYKILETRWHKHQARIRVEGVTRIEHAEALIGMTVAVSKDDLPDLDEGEYMIRDLIGIEVFDESGAKVGVVEDVIQGAAQDLYQIAGTLVPAVREFILEVDVAARRMTIRPLPGMFE